jgi:hypothetical protein
MVFKKPGPLRDEKLKFLCQIEYGGSHRNQLDPGSMQVVRNRNHLQEKNAERHVSVIVKNKRLQLELK